MQGSRCAYFITRVKFDRNREAYWERTDVIILCTFRWKSIFRCYKCLASYARDGRTEAV
jgi:hypothetical protein